MYVCQFFILFLLQICSGLPDGLHPTPMMGFSSWNTFFATNDEVKMRGIADAIKWLELDKFGYVYLTVDDFWNTPERDVNGDMVTNGTRFPSGMKHLGDYLHNRGLKFGIYSDAGKNFNKNTCWNILSGAKTCGGMAGSIGNEVQDLNLFLSFGIDYLKYDNCYPVEGSREIHIMDDEMSEAHAPSDYQDPAEQTRFQPMAATLLAANPRRNITFELCLYGWGNVEQWGPSMGHLWRTSGDISDEWISVLKNIDRNDERRFLTRQGPALGAWNYPDALFVGKGGMTETEYRTMFALWCSVKSPLMLGNDLRNMEKTDWAYKILTNTDLLAINQDSLGVQATCVKNCCGRSSKQGGKDTSKTCPMFRSAWQVWTGPLSGGSIVIVVVNRFDSEKNINLNWASDANVPAGCYHLRNLWSQTDIGVITVNETTMYEENLPAHGNWAFKLTPEQKDEEKVNISVV